MVLTITTTASSTSRILELTVQPCYVQLPMDVAARQAFLQLSGTFPMERKFQILLTGRMHHTIEQGLAGILVLEQYVSIANLKAPQQESSTVTYMMPMEISRVSMWGYTLPQ